jgi:hypothetical protein
MSTRTKLSAALAVVVLIVVALAALAVRSQSADPGSPAGQQNQRPTGSPSSAGGSDGTQLSPLTGAPAPAGQPVLAVKIDNVAPARPQTGIGQADVIYVEPVEGGLSRLMAIFSSRMPPRLGPIRSARESDLELLAQYGRPGLAYSGANRQVLTAIRAAPVVDLSPSSVSAPYRRSSARAAPHNLFADPKALLAGATSVSAARDIGFRFGDLPLGAGTTKKRQTVRYGAASTGFTWSPTRHRWLVSLDGRAATTTDGGRLGASTVVLQYTDITSSDLRDTLGNPTPYPHTVGSGQAVVLRDGVAIKARWSRPSAATGTTFTTPEGAALPFASGQVWVVFAAPPKR